MRDGTHCSLRGVTIADNYFSLNQVDHDRSSCYGIGFSVASAANAVEEVTITKVEPFQVMRRKPRNGLDPAGPAVRGE